MLLKIKVILYHLYFTISVIMIVICFFRKLVDKKNEKKNERRRMKKKVEFDVIPKTNEEYISMSYGCIIIIDSYRFLSSSLDSLIQTLVDDSNKTLKSLKEEIVDKDEILNIVNEIVEENKNFKDLKKDHPDKIKNLEEAPLIYMGENDLKISKTGFPDKWKY